MYSCSLACIMLNAGALWGQMPKVWRNHEIAGIGQAKHTMRGCLHRWASFLGRCRFSGTLNGTQPCYIAKNAMAVIHVILPYSFHSNRSTWEFRSTGSSTETRDETTGLGDGRKKLSPEEIEQKKKEAEELGGDAFGFGESIVPMSTHTDPDHKKRTCSTEMTASPKPPPAHAKERIPLPGPCFV